MSWFFSLLLDHLWRTTRSKNCCWSKDGRSWRRSGQFREQLLNSIESGKRSEFEVVSKERRDKVNWARRRQEEGERGGKKEEEGI